MSVQSVQEAPESISSLPCKVVQITRKHDDGEHVVFRREVPGIDGGAAGRGNLSRNRTGPSAQLA